MHGVSQLVARIRTSLRAEGLSATLKKAFPSVRAATANSLVSEDADCSHPQVRGEFQPNAVGGHPTPPEWNLLRAKDVFDSSGRFDLIFKYLYALSINEPNSVRQKVRDNYVEHIRAFNNFFEEDPPKATASDFVSSFDALIQSIVTRGIDPKISQVLVSDDCTLVAGAHRLSTAAAFGIDIPAKVTDIKAPYDYRFFAKRGLDAGLMEEMSRRWIHVNPSARLVICYSNVSPSQDSDIVEPVLREAGFVFHRVQFSLKMSGIVNLKLLAYPAEINQWVGTTENGFAGAVSHARKSQGPFDVRVYIVRPTSTASLINAKQVARERLGLKNFALHSTDDHLETTRLADALLSKSGRMALSLRSWVSDSQAFDEMVDDYRESISLHNHDINHFLLVGSSPLGALGLRNPRDLDYLHLSDCTRSVHFDGQSGIDSHARYARYYGNNTESLILNEKNHFWYRGVKILSPQIFLGMKIRRREWPKDFVDARLLLSQYIRTHLLS